MASREGSGGQDGRIRVAIGTKSGVPADLVRAAVHQQPDMHLVGVASGARALIRIARRRADVIVLNGVRAFPAPGVLSDVLGIAPHAKVLVLSTSDDAAAVYWLQLRRELLDAESSHTVAGAIRAAHALEPRI
jgi:DNA-binding NarL/FixJ family response regulator